LLWLVPVVPGSSFSGQLCCSPPLFSSFGGHVTPCHVLLLVSTPVILVFSHMQVLISLGDLPILPFASPPSIFVDSPFDTQHLLSPLDTSCCTCSVHLQFSICSRAHWLICPSPICFCHQGLLIILPCKTLADLPFSKLLIPQLASLPAGHTG